MDCGCCVNHDHLQFKSWKNGATNKQTNKPHHDLCVSFVNKPAGCIRLLGHRWPAVSSAKGRMHTTLRKMTTRGLAEWGTAWRFPVDLAARKYSLWLFYHLLSSSLSASICDSKINTELSSSKEGFNLQTLINTATCSLKFWFWNVGCICWGMYYVIVSSLNPITLFGTKCRSPAPLTVEAGNQGVRFSAFKFNIKHLEEHVQSQFPSKKINFSRLESWRGEQ